MLKTKNIFKKVVQYYNINAKLQKFSSVMDRVLYISPLLATIGLILLGIPV